MATLDYEPSRRPGSPGIGQLRMLSATTWLIIINVAVFLLDRVLVGLKYYYPENVGNYIIAYPPLEGLGHFSLYLAVWKLEIWRFITFQFLHAGLTHIAFNMIALYFFGPLVENYLGLRRYLAFYLLCGIGGPIAYMILWATKFLIVSPIVPLVGASAGIFGVLIAAAQIAPTATVLIYGILPMQLRTLAWVLLGIAVYTVLVYGNSRTGNAGGEAAHLGGAAVGFILMRNI
ncbi:MAG TPA: rhomboid family intramembrane serine protease, partial [Tepidisphaeraceae bacterium]|nr:rhomboid family intramembrane serine protease [Tepidisphaeraceae bacterium]